MSGRASDRSSNPASARYWGAALIAALACVPARAADLPVVASRLVTGPNSHVDLTNTSDQPVTSWTIVVTTEQGGVTRQVRRTVDAYLAEVTKDLPGMSVAVDRLMPGQTREITLDPAAPGTKVEVTAVVLQDGTALGDEEILESVFEQRARERDQLREVVEVFERVLSSSKGIPALEGLKRAFAVQTPGAESPPHQSSREAVDAYLQRATPATEDLAEKHWQRKR
jgi:hypothetical protein